MSLAREPNTVYLQLVSPLLSHPSMTHTRVNTQIHMVHNLNLRGIDNEQKKISNAPTFGVQCPTSSVTHAFMAQSGAIVKIPPL